MRNVLVTGALYALVLWWVRDRILENRAALLLGLATGALYGPLHWWQLSRKVSRQDRRFDWVRFISVPSLPSFALAWGIQ